MINSRISLLVALVLAVATGIALGLLFHSGETSAIKQLMAGLQEKQSVASGKLAKTEALLSLRDAQIKNMQQQLQHDNEDIQHMQQRLDLFDQVLAGRKLAGVHFLRPSAIWQGDHNIAYQLILVKGNNYPRWIKGHLAFRALDREGHSALLTPAKIAKSGFKIEMTEQSFIEGVLHWQQPWQAQTLRMTLINHLGRNKGSIEIPIKQPEPAATEQPS